MSNEVPLRRDHTFVARTPAAEKARSTSASTDVAGMVNKYAYTCFRQRPLVPLFSNTASWALMEFASYLLTETREAALRPEAASITDSGKDMDSCMAISGGFCLIVGSAITATCG